MDYNTNEVMWTIDGTKEDALNTISTEHGEGVVYIPDDEKDEWNYQ